MQTCIGHEVLQSELERLAGLPEMPQSFLFCGPRHVGKRLVAEWFAQRLIDATHHGDFSQNLLIVEPSEAISAKRTREQFIPVDTIREAQKFLSLSPVAGKRRVLIVDGAEKLSTGAANALLKILEEPPEKSLLILITAEPGSLLPTILSRLVSMHFHPVSGKVVQKYVVGAQDLPQFFFDLGLPGVVVEAVRSPEQFSVKKEILRSLFQLSKLSLYDRMTLAETLAKDERVARDLLEIWCIGLVFQVRRKSGGISTHYVFLEQVLATLKVLHRGEGSLRSLLEKLFFCL